MKFGRTYKWDICIIQKGQYLATQLDSFSPQCTALLEMYIIVKLHECVWRCHYHTSDRPVWHTIFHLLENYLSLLLGIAFGTTEPETSGPPSNGSERPKMISVMRSAINFRWQDAVFSDQVYTLLSMRRSMLDRKYSHFSLGQSMQNNPLCRSRKDMWQYVYVCVDRRPAEFASTQHIVFPAHYCAYHDYTRFVKRIRDLPPQWIG